MKMERRRSTQVTLEPSALAAFFAQQNVLSVKDALGIIHEAQDLMNEEPNMVRVGADVIYVFGDIHGQFFDLVQLMDAIGQDALANDNIRLVFLGDYVDRGAFSCEVILYLLLLKIRYPTKITLLRGNHECETISSFYGFRNECRVKYGLSVYYHFVSCFQTMPIAALLATERGHMLCIHGGISPDVRTLEDIDAIDRRREIPMEGPLCDLLWSDPLTDHQECAANAPLWSVNKVRGCSYYFSAAALFGFLETNKLLCVIRAHEFEQQGYMSHFNTDNFDALDTRVDKVVAPLMTVFSAPNYCDTNGNKAAYFAIQTSPFRLEVKQIDTIGHPIPSLVSVERGADIWRQFRQTLPFLPASKDFFEEVLHLSGKQHKLTAASVPRTPSLVESEQPEQFAMDDLIEVQRRRTSEMHPQAIRRVLDEEASKWMQSDDGAGELAVFPDADASAELDCGGQSSNSHHRSQALLPAEVEMMKLIFSLLDTDGSMTLNTTEVTQFVFNILGERISIDVAEVYLDALDFDRNGIVDFSDILSWAAVLKANNDDQNQSALSLSQITRKCTSLLRTIDPHRGFLWLSVAWIVHDVLIKRRQRLIRSKSSIALVSIALLVYTVDAVRLCRTLPWMQWCELLPLWRVVSSWRKK